MSTRCNIIIKDGNEQAIFYRHSDGYPEGALPTLNLFMEWVKAGKIRDNLGQASGWLILIGHDEYIADGSCGTVEHHKAGTQNGKYDFAQWKCGAYEPTNCIHGDIEYIYELDLNKKTVNGWEHDGDNYQKQVVFNGVA